VGGGEEKKRGGGALVGGKGRVRKESSGRRYMKIGGMDKEKCKK